MPRDLVTGSATRIACRPVLRDHPRALPLQRRHQLHGSHRGLHTRGVVRRATQVCRRSAAAPLPGCLLPCGCQDVSACGAPAPPRCSRAALPPPFVSPQRRAHRQTTRTVAPSRRYGEQLPSPHKRPVTLATSSRLPLRAPGISRFAASSHRRARGRNTPRPHSSARSPWRPTRWPRLTRRCSGPGRSLVLPDSLQLATRRLPVARGGRAAERQR